jgi:hypothetical protein
MIALIALCVLLYKVSYNPNYLLSQSAKKQSDALTDQAQAKMDVWNKLEVDRGGLEKQQRDKRATMTPEEAVAMSGKIAKIKAQQDSVQSMAQKIRDEAKAAELKAMHLRAKSFGVFRGIVFWALAVVLIAVGTGVKSPQLKLGGYWSAALGVVMVVYSMWLKV